MKKNSERRVSSRIAVSGGVTISLQDPVPATIGAELLDTSASGFRVAHHSKALSPGLEVSYTFAGASGRARVIWTHVLDDRRMSGFIRVS